MKNFIPKSSLLIAILLAAGAAATHAATCSVPSSTYPTIQTAVDDSACNTVEVAPGIYSENVSITRAVTLSGAQAGQPTGNRVSGGPSESTVIGANPTGSRAVFAVGASGVTIDGFTVKNSVSAGAATGVEVRASNDAVVLNNFIDGIESADAAGRAQAVHLRNGLINANVGNNEIRNVTSSSTATGILFGDNDGTEGPQIAFLHDNTISGITSTAGCAAGVFAVKVSPMNGSFYFRNGHISNVTAAGWAHGVRLEAVDARNPLTMETEFAGLNSGSGDVAAISFINVPLAYSADSSGNLFFLADPAYGVRVVGANATLYPGPMSAGCNWWGSADGPGPVAFGHGCRVSPDVRYSPWRVSPVFFDPSVCVGNNVPTTEAQCKNGGWIVQVRADGSTFKSQGDCLQYVNNGK
jgi:hypothetical protein